MKEFNKKTILYFREFNEQVPESTRVSEEELLQAIKLAQNVSKFEE